MKTTLSNITSNLKMNLNMIQNSRKSVNLPDYKPSNTPCWKLFPLVSLFCLPVFTGCSQDADNLFPEVPDTEQPGDNIDSNESVIIGASVDAVDEYFGGAVTRTGETIERIVQPLDSTRDTGYDVVTTIESIPLANPIQTRANLNNVKFRVVAYSGNSTASGNYRGTAVFQTSSSGVASIVNGTAEPASSSNQWILAPGTYSFVCYSLGNANPPSKLTDNTSLSVNHGQDFMTCHKMNVSVTAGSDGQYMLKDIKFVRQCAKLQIAFKSEAYSNNTVTACAATVSNTNSTPLTWNTSQTSLTDSGTDGTLNVAWNSPNAATVTSNSYYVLPQSSRTIGITFTSLTIGETPYDNTVTVSPTDRVFAAKGNYKISITLKPNKIEWAPGNLVKSGNSYSFAGKTAYGSYFGWNTLSDAKGDNNTGEYSKANDPCTKVSPTGTWVTPTKEQLDELKASGGSWTGSGWQFGGKYSDVFLPAAGYRGSGGTMYSVGSDGYCWSSTPYDSSDAYYLYFYAGDVNVNYASRSYGLSVRCVKG